MKQPTQTCACVFDALAHTPQEAADVRARAELSQALTALVPASGWTQTKAVLRCGVTQPCVNDLLRGRISRFSLDAPVDTAVVCGQRVWVTLEAAVR